jgi:hypothetical protein
MLAAFNRRTESALRKRPVTDAETPDIQDRWLLQRRGELGTLISLARRRPRRSDPLTSFDSPLGPMLITATSKAFAARLTTKRPDHRP